MKKNVYIKSIVFVLIIFFSILITNNVVNAQGDIFEIINDNDYTEDFKRWEKLPDEEKQNYIQPMPFGSTINVNENLNNRNINLNQIEIPSYYKLNDLTVRNQLGTSSCWAFTTTNMISTNIQKTKSTNLFTLLSVRHMNYATSLNFADGKNPVGFNRPASNGGNVFLGLAYCTSGNGPILENEMPFQNNSNLIKLSEIQNKNTVTKINDYTQYTGLYKKISNNNIIYYNGYSNNSNKYHEYTNNEVSSIRNPIKTQIINNGAVSAYTYSGTQYFNNYWGTSNVAYYCDNTNINPDHAVTIVGWDDNYSKDNFRQDCKPKNDGAYIVLNSWGEDWGNQGYYYISYDDVLVEKNPVGIKSTQDINYDEIYQHDELGYSYSISFNDGFGNARKEVKIANVFDKQQSKNPQTKQMLTQVSFSLMEETDVEIYVNLNSSDKTTLTKVSNMQKYEAGYHTISLDTPLEITSEKFVIAAKLYSETGAVVPLELNYIQNGIASSFWDTAKGNAGESFIGINYNWTDVVNGLGYKNTNLCIKGFVKEEQIPVEGVKLNVSQLKIQETKKANLVATILPQNATNRKLIWTSSDESIVTVSQTGEITAMKQGDAIITVETQEGGYKATCNITVEKREVGVSYLSHVQDIGWMNYVSDGQTSGVENRGLKLEAIQIRLTNSISQEHIKYQAHVQDIGWMDYVYDNRQAGTTGQNKKVEAIRIKLEGVPGYSAEYRAYVNGAWQNWVSDGITSGTVGQNQKLEAIQIRIIKTQNKNQVAPGVTYQGHVQDIGWMNYVSDGQTSGVENRGLKVEAFRINLTNVDDNSHIKYQTHVQDIGWMNYVSDIQQSGTTGQNKKVEAIRIKLEGLPGYSVEYRAFVNGAWQNWVSDGITSGTTGQNLKLEAVQIRVIKSENKITVNPGIMAKGHIQDIGWQNWIQNTQSSNSIKIGIENIDKKIEAIQLALTNVDENSHIKYKTHVQDIGWLEYTSDGNASGTVGQNKKIEAVCVQIEGMPNYSVEYRAFVKGAWQDWVSNGDISGTTGMNLKMEAFEIRIVEK